MEILGELLALIGKIPATFWGVVFGSVFALLGIKWTNRANDRRLQAQLSHESEMQKKERELSLRKDVYLAAVEAMSAGIVAVNRFTDVCIPSNNLTEMYYEKAPSIDKVRVIAGEDTVRALGHFMRELNTAWAQLLTKRAPLEVLNHQLNILAQRIASLEKERERTTELIKQRNLDGVEDPKLLERMRKASKFEQSLSEELGNKRSVLVADSFTKGLIYSAECISESARLNELLVPVLISMREELELPITKNAFEEDSRKMQEHVRESAEKIRQFVTTQLG